jgi:hypothetical protein
MTLPILQTRTAILLLIAIVTMGTMAATTAIVSAETADAKSCHTQIALCHGCAVDSQGTESSEGKCFHR